MNGIGRKVVGPTSSTGGGLQACPTAARIVKMALGRMKCRSSNLLIVDRLKTKSVPYDAKVDVVVVMQQSRLLVECVTSYQAQMGASANLSSVASRVQHSYTFTRILLHRVMPYHPPSGQLWKEEIHASTAAITCKTERRGIKLRRTAPEPSTNPRSMPPEGNAKER